MAHRVASLRRNDLSAIRGTAGSRKLSRPGAWMRSRPKAQPRALNNGAPNIERADKLVQLIAKQKGLSHPTIDAIVALVDASKIKAWRFRRREFRPLSGRCWV